MKVLQSGWRLSGNPTGSTRSNGDLCDKEALRKGNLTLSQTVVEYTGGSTGSALAFEQPLGIKFTAIFSDAFSFETAAMVHLVQRLL